MYFIINRTTNETTIRTGDWTSLNKLLDNGNDIIVFSTYSNTIKVPRKDEYDEWDWVDYPFPLELK